MDSIIVPVPVVGPSLNELYSQYAIVKKRYTRRDARMGQILSIREGRISDVSPELFPETGPFQEPIVANMIDVAARDLAGMLSPLPKFSCTSTSMVTNTQKQRATVKTKIAGGYISNSDLQIQMESSSDEYLSYGILPGRVEIDYESNMPVIRLLDPVGAYPTMDRYGRVISLFQRILVSRDELAAQYPEFANKIIDRNNYGQSETIEVILYHDKTVDLAFTQEQGGVVLSRVSNPIGKCMIRVAARPGVTDIPRGQFDDVIFIQLAKARLALLALQQAQDSVNAPLVVPNDVGEIPYGPGATIRTNNPAGVMRVQNPIPAAAFQEQGQLDRELKLGARFPEVRTGNSDASIITGKGVQALMGGYDAQIRVHQAIFARFLQDLVSLCFEVDEIVFGSMKKVLRGSEHGNSYEVTYVPTKDIAGDYTVQAKYGLLAGLDPNSWMVWMSQAKQSKMFSTDYMRREMPGSGDMDIEDEARKIDMEAVENAALVSILGLAQSIPALAAQGQDPSKTVALIAQIVSSRGRGKSMMESLELAFPVPAPTPPPVEELPGQEQMGMGMGELPGSEQQMGQRQPMGQQQPMGSPQQMGTIPGNAARPTDLATIMSSLKGGAKGASMSVGTKTQIPR